MKKIIIIFFPIFTVLFLTSSNPGNEGNCGQSLSPLRCPEEPRSKNCVKDNRWACIFWTAHECSGEAITRTQMYVGDLGECIDDPSSDLVCGQETVPCVRVVGDICTTTLLFECALAKVVGTSSSVTDCIVTPQPGYTLFQEACECL